MLASGGRALVLSRHLLAKPHPYIALTASHCQFSVQIVVYKMEVAYLVYSPP